MTVGSASERIWVSDFFGRDRLRCRLEGRYVGSSGLAPVADRARIEEVEMRNGRSLAAGLVAVIWLGLAGPG